MGGQKKTVGAVVLIIAAVVALVFSYMKFFSGPKTLPLDEMLKKRQEVEAQYGSPRGPVSRQPGPPGGGMSAPSGAGGGR
jgi:hypothetical protein